MIELRTAPRVNVNWRCGLKLPDSRLLMCKAINVSSEGILLFSPEPLQVSSSYPAMLEIPALQDREQLFHINCKAQVLHNILSDGVFRVGIQVSGMSDLHRELVNAWVSKAGKKFP
jgi:hypothetical protein